MNVRRLIAQLEGMDPEADVRFCHLRRVMDDGTGRVESYPVLDVVANEGEEEVSLSDFLTEGPCLYKVRRVEWEQPALSGHPVGDDEDDGVPEGAASAAAEPPVDTLLVDPPFTREEWADVKFDDMKGGGTALGLRVLEYVRRYHTAVMRSNRLGGLLSAAGVPSGPGDPFSERVLRRVLRRLVERHDATVGGLETMMAVGEFARFLGERQGVSLSPRTRGWLGKVESLALATLVLCVNKHFGMTA